MENKNFLFVDGRYTIQAQKESGKNFKIVEYNKIVNCDLFKNLTLQKDHFNKIISKYYKKKHFLYYSMGRFALYNILKNEI